MAKDGLHPMHDLPYKRTGRAAVLGWSVLPTYSGRDAFIVGGKVEGKNGFGRKRWRERECFECVDEERERGGDGDSEEEDGGEVDGDGRTGAVSYDSIAVVQQCWVL